MSRVRLIIEYDGTAYVGWQTQPNGLAVQEVLEHELHKVTGEKVNLTASGRTDSGVHALAQVAHFDTVSRIPPEKFAYALNAGLPRDIRVQYSGRCGDEFHARFSVVKKHYRYAVWNAPHASAFFRNTALHVHDAVDMDKMNGEAISLLGCRDFAAFQSSGGADRGTVRTIYESGWTKNGNLLVYDVCGSGFLYNMVRILVGTMLEAGMGLREAGAFAAAFESGRRSDLGATAPACGLMLRRVEYPDFDTADYLV